VSRDLYDLERYTVVLDKVVHVTQVFSAGEEGFQFNVALVGDNRLKLKYPDRSEAAMARELFVKALEA
jgi:hypothetical protein